MGPCEAPGPVSLLFLLLRPLESVPSTRNSPDLEMIFKCKHQDLASMLPVPQLFFFFFLFLPYLSQFWVKGK